MRSTNESRRMVKAWIAVNDGKVHDQAILNKLAFKEYVVSEGPGIASLDLGWPPWT